MEKGGAQQCDCILPIIWTCAKSITSPVQTDSIPHFLRKLQAKKQTEAQQQTLHAITLHYELLQDWVPGSLFCSPQEKIAHGKSAKEFRPPTELSLERDNGAVQGDGTDGLSS